MIKITLPDGSVKEFESGVTGHEVALSISEGLARNVLAAEVNGELVDLSQPITADAKVRLITAQDPEGVEVETSPHRYGNRIDED